MRPEGFVTVDGQRFIDPQGRHVLLHGMSVISKSKTENYLSWHGPAEFAQMRAWGMNCVRLGILWDGVEPAPGAYDEEYLKGVDQRIAWAKDNGLYVFLDMHQDLFSVLYSDGAPEWATLTNGKPHVNTGGVWSDAYFTSPAVQTAFDNFWANAPGPDGVGIQDRFALAWQHIAARYAGEPAVIGYDLFNEPNLGTRNSEGQLLMVSKGAELIAQKDGASAPTIDQLAAQWLDPQGRSQLMKRLEDMEIYEEVVNAAAPLYQEFERTQVMAMYKRVADAIRQVAPHHIIMLETAMPSNMGVLSGIEPLTGPDGQRDPYQAYAPHGYDIVVDTPDIARASTARIEFIFRRHGETAKRLDMPMVVGEWGAYGGAGPEILPTARVVVRQFEDLLCGDTYWEFGRYVAQCAYLEVLNRPVPVAVAGALLAYRWEPETNAFTCSWQEDPAIEAPSCFYLPERCFSGAESVQVSPAGESPRIEPSGEQSRGVYVFLSGVGDKVERRLSVSNADAKQDEGGTEPMASKNTAIPEAGAKAPAFSLLSNTGETVTLDGLAGKPVVLYFYPKDDTPGCTIEAKEFRDLMPEFEKLGAVVLGVSPDSIESHCGFIDKHGLNFTLLADTDHTVAGKYGVLVEKEAQGKKSWGIQRATFLIGRDGTLAKAWPKVSPNGHAAEVLEAVKSLAAR